MSKNHDVHIIGGGLAGCEAAWQLARRGLRVRLSEMRGVGSSRVDLQACKLEYSIVSPK